MERKGIQRSNTRRFSVRENAERNRNNMERLFCTDNMTEKVIMCLSIYEEVNQEDLKCIIPKEKLSKHINRLQTRGLIKKRKVKNIKTLSLTLDGVNHLTRYDSFWYDTYKLDAPLEQRDEYRMTYQRRVRSQLAFIVGNIKADMFTKIEESINTPIYLDSYSVKKQLGEEIKGSRATGFCITPEETFITYATEGGFAVIPPVEDKLKNRLKNLLPQTSARDEMKEIVITTNIESIKNILKPTRYVNKLMQTYTATMTEREKYFVPIEYARLQIPLITHKKLRDEFINRKLSEVIGSKVNNRECINYSEDRKIVSLLDLNLGLISYTRAMSTGGQNITAVVLDKYQPFFDKLFNGLVEFMTVTEEDIYSIMREYGLEM